MVSEKPSRGDLYWVDWHPARGSEQSGVRPAVVVQTDVANGNPAYPLTVVVAVSTSGRSVPFHVPIAPSVQTGLERASFAKCEQLLTITKRRLVRRLGRVTQEEMDQISDGLRAVLAL